MAQLAQLHQLGQFHRQAQVLHLILVYLENPVSLKAQYHLSGQKGQELQYCPLDLVVPKGQVDLKRDENIFLKDYIQP